MAALAGADKRGDSRRSELTVSRLMRVERPSDLIDDDDLERGYRVRRWAKRIQLDHLALHDLRKACAKLCHVSGGELEQIQFLLGHIFVLATERYLGCKHSLRGTYERSFRCLLASTLVDLHLKACCRHSTTMRNQIDETGRLT